MLSVTQLLRMSGSHMSQEEGAKGSDSLAWTSREMWREVPQECHQEPEIQHRHFCARGKAISKALMHVVLVFACFDIAIIYFYWCFSSILLILFILYTFEFKARHVLSIKSVEKRFWCRFSIAVCACVYLSPGCLKWNLYPECSQQICSVIRLMCN